MCIIEVLNQLKEHNGAKAFLLGYFSSPDSTIPGKISEDNKGIHIEEAGDIISYLTKEDFAEELEDELKNHIFSYKDTDSIRDLKLANFPVGSLVYKAESPDYFDGFISSLPVTLYDGQFFESIKFMFDDELFSIIMLDNYICEVNGELVLQPQALFFDSGFEYDPEDIDSIDTSQVIFLAERDDIISRCPKLRGVILENYSNLQYVENCDYVEINRKLVINKFNINIFYDCAKIYKKYFRNIGRRTKSARN